MPRNRSELSREEKSGEITLVAERLFLEQGYEGTTMSGIAREAGVASNVVHWYFPTKDELFVAVMETLHLRDLKKATDELASLRAEGKKADEQGSEAEILASFVCRLLDRHLLVTTLHERSKYSEVVAQYHIKVHERYTQALESGIARSGVPLGERSLVVDALITAIEGLVMHRASEQEVRRMIYFLVGRLTPLTPGSVK